MWPHTWRSIMEQTKYEVFAACVVRSLNNPDNWIEEMDFEFKRHVVLSCITATKRQFRYDRSVAALVTSMEYSHGHAMIIDALIEGYLRHGVLRFVRDE